MQCFESWKRTRTLSTYAVERFCNLFFQDTKRHVMNHRRCFAEEKRKPLYKAYKGHKVFGNAKKDMMAFLTQVLT